MLEYQQATEAHDVQAVIALLAPDIIVRSPITTRIRFEGIDDVSDLFIRIFDILSDIRFYETIGEGESSQVIFWRARVGKHYLEEANLLRLDDQGRIKEMTVFMRPLPGVLALATTLVASFAGRKGRIRGFIVKAMLGGLSTVFRTGEPLILKLSAAGTKTTDPTA
jgi:SnoaL-like domain